MKQERFYLKNSSRTTNAAFAKTIEASVGRIMISLKARRTSMSPSTGHKIIETVIDNAFALVTKRISELNPVDFRTIHRVRLAFKPFRYLLETFHPLFPTNERRVGTAPALARIMGNIQDCDVLMKNLVEYKWKNERQRKAMLEIWQETERRKIEITQRLLGSVKKFGELWKPLPQRYTGERTNLATVYILRHAIAVLRGDPSYPLDSDRPLTTKGVKRMRRLANGIHSMGVEFDLILTSPYRRALETAFILAKQYRVGQAIQTSQQLTPEVNPSELLSELQLKYRACKSIILVGHEPQLSSFISTLTVGNMSSPAVLKKGGLCKLQISKLEEGKATMSWLLTPKQLVAMA
jgi:phosphohistidine phosphatase